ncbi:hypothetical protein [Bacteroides fragilis]|uniref:hypothetical protein n=1 Tax=Bacteroides fragilis TaxID=817 RepID=UPI0020301A3F|nr:hypothetical protein [Bacteroides fragilis]MCM0270238.1 hypothetical protein [Bacteroides fragilis]
MILSLLTRVDIAVLYDTPSLVSVLSTNRYGVFGDTSASVLSKFVCGGLVGLKSPLLDSSLCGYELCHPCHRINLLDTLEAIGEHLDCSEIRLPDL